MTSCRCRQQGGRDFSCTHRHTQDTSYLLGVSKSTYDTTRELMFELERSYLDTTSRFGRCYRIWFLAYHGLEAITQLLTGRSVMQMYDTVQLHTYCPSMSPGIPRSYNSRPLPSWISFGHFHPVPRK